MELKGAQYNPETDTIILVQQKTGAKVHVPIFNDLHRNIMSEYNYRFPKMGAHKFNATLQKVAEMAGLTDTLTFTEQRRKEIITKTVRRCDMITSHDTRHSYTTNRLKEGYTQAQIMTPGFRLIFLKFIPVLQPTEHVPPTNSSR
jgi:hypothetical protein